MRAHTNYTIQHLRFMVTDGLDSVIVENIMNYFREARNYLFAYMEGTAGGNELEDKMKKYKKIY